MRILLITLLICSYAIPNNNIAFLAKSESTPGVVAFSINSNEDVLGVQFDLQYNPEELIFNGATALEGYHFEYRDRDNGQTRGLLFSMSGEVINTESIHEIIQFDFQPIEGFNGESVVEFIELLFAGHHGEKIPVQLSSFIISTETEIPSRTTLHDCYPNPFNPSTTIPYDVAKDGQVTLAVYDLQGRLVAELTNEMHSAGKYQMTWNANEYASGVYFLKMTVNDFSSSQKIVLTK